MQLAKILVITVILLGLLAGCTNSAVGELDVLVKNANNEPLAGAKVVSNTQPDGQLKVTGITNSEGKVIFKDIKPGNYEFYVSYYGQKGFSVTVKAGKVTTTTVITGSS
ncbi:MAG: carboxypeptidase-like regulatory domain-containing protein [Paludibacter sp.]|nr:carboxypeptidase-like regulatory domain-containing protein [Paludibacter sp.]